MALISHQTTAVEAAVYRSQTFASFHREALPGASVNNYHVGFYDCDFHGGVAVDGSIGTNATIEVAHSRFCNTTAIAGTPLSSRIQPNVAGGTQPPMQQLSIFFRNNTVIGQGLLIGINSGGTMLICETGCSIAVEGNRFTDGGLSLRAIIFNSTDARAPKAREDLIRVAFNSFDVRYFDGDSSAVLLHNVEVTAPAALVLEGNTFDINTTRDAPYRGIYIYDSVVRRARATVSDVSLGGILATPTLVIRGNIMQHRSVIARRLS